MKPVAQAITLGSFVAACAAGAFFLAADRSDPDLPFRIAVIFAIGFFCAAAVAYLLITRGIIRRADQGPKAPPSETGTLLTSLFTFTVLGYLGWSIAGATGHPISEQLRFDLQAVALGAILTVPPVLMLHLIMTLEHPPVRAFRERQVRLFTERGFDVGWPTILAISFGAGISEEILFRGALQPLFQDWTTPLAGLLLASALFGLAHAANWTYIAITAVVGVYYGVITMALGNLLVPILGHALYDVYALAVTVKAVRAAKAAA